MRRRSGRIIATAQRVGSLRARSPEEPGFYQTLWSFMYIISQHYTCHSGRSVTGYLIRPFTFSAMSTRRRCKVHESGGGTSLVLA